MRVALLVSCEHGGYQVPTRYRPLFSPHADLLKTHRGYDPGALRMARHLAEAWNAPLHTSEITRLLVELNRSERHPQLFSEITRSLPRTERLAILDAHYRPYRAAVERDIAEHISRGAQVLHLSIHSFTPVLHGQTRNADIGLLYDPGRAGERRLAVAWQKALRKRVPSLRVRRNYPYLGKADGFTTHLRRRFPRAYLGLELEVNQALAGTAQWRPLCSHIMASFPLASQPSG